jgi:hypothetical protein
MARSSLSTACKHRLDVAKRLILLVRLHDAWRLGKLGRCDPAMLVRLFGSLSTPADTLPAYGPVRAGETPAADRQSDEIRVSRRWAAIRSRRPSS